MTPLETFRFLNKKDVDLRAMMILERLDFYNRPIMTGQIVTDATTNSAFASQATVFKYLIKLKDRKFVEEIDEVSDQRCTYIQITNNGRKLLKEWS